MRKIRYVAWPCAGRASAGAIAVTATTSPKIGDYVLCVINSTTGGDVTASMETRITVADQIQQAKTTGISVSDALIVFARRR